MSPAQKALWYIESHLAGALSLDEIAAIGGVSALSHGAGFCCRHRSVGDALRPEQHYAVFTHRDHVAGIRRTMNTIWNDWLPSSGRQVADGPMFERYGESFDPRTGNGGFEIWLPLKS